MKRILYTIILYFYFISSCYAQDAVTVKQGTQVPFNGVLLPPDKAEEMKNTIVERDGYKKLNDSLNLTINLQDDLISRKDNQIKVILDQNEVLNKADKPVNNLEKALWFSGGILTTILILYGVKAATK